MCRGRRLLAGETWDNEHGPNPKNPPSEVSEGGEGDERPIVCSDPVTARTARRDSLLPQQPLKIKTPNSRSEDREKVNSAKVLDAALTLFAQRGYHGTSLQDVAKLLRIRTPSLYNHMDSKQALLAVIIVETTEAVWSDYADAVEGIEGPGANTKKLRAAVAAYAYRHARYPREAIIVNRDVSALEEPHHEVVMGLRRQHEAAIRQIIIDGAEAGEFEVENPLLTSFGLLEMCVSIARWYRADRGLSAEEVSGEYAELALRLVGAGPKKRRPRA